MAEQQEARELDVEAWEWRAAACRTPVGRLLWLAGASHGRDEHGGIGRQCVVDTLVVDTHRR